VYFTGAISTLGSGPTQVKQPVSIAFGADGELFVGGLEDPHIAVWDARLQPTTDWKLDGAVLGMAIDRLERVFVPDPKLREVRMFDAAGNLLAEIAAAPSPELPLDGPSQVGLTADESALWVLGRNGLARVDLLPLAGVVVAAPAPYPRWARAVAEVGAAVALASLIVLRWSAVRRLWLAPPSPRRVLDQPRRTLVEARIATVIGLVVWLAAGVVAIGGEVVARGPHHEDAVPWLVAAALLGLASVKALEAGASDNASVVSMHRTPVDGGWPAGRQRTIGAGLLALGGVAALVSTRLVVESTTIPLATAVWVDALTLVAAGAVVLGRGPTDSYRWRWRVSGLVEAACLGLVVLIAVLLRLPDLATVPPNLGADEGGMGSGARQVLAGTMPSVFATGWFAVPALSFSIHAATMRMFGDSVFGLRMASVIEGVLSVVALYLLVRRQWGGRPAIVAAAFLAIAAWHIHFSRMGSHHMLAPLVTLVALYFLVRAIDDRRLIDWVLCGFAVGLSIEVYYAARIAPLLVAAYVAYLVATERWQFVRTHAAGLAALAFSAAVFLAPMAMVYARDRGAFNARTDAVAIANTPAVVRPESGSTRAGALLRELGTQSQGTLEAFHIRGDTDRQYAHGGDPLVDWWNGALLAMGAAAILLRPETPRGFMLAACVWLPLLVGSLLTADAFQAQRELVVLPFVMIVPALMAEYAWRGMKRLAGRLGTYAFGGVAVMAVFLALQANVHDYFEVEIVRRMPADQLTQLALEASEIQDRYRPYVIGKIDGTLSDEAPRFLLPHHDVVQVGDAPLALPQDRIPADKGVAFLVLNGAADRAQRLAAIKQAYPEGRTEAVNQPPGSRAPRHLLAT
jgi:4-amino-4-deoxy-L-arabinose transferase-like glycosyltransferase